MLVWLIASCAATIWISLTEHPFQCTTISSDMKQWNRKLLPGSSHQETQEYCPQHLLCFFFFQRVARWHGEWLQKALVTIKSWERWYITAFIHWTQTVALSEVLYSWHEDDDRFFAIWTSRELPVLKLQDYVDLIMNERPRYIHRLIYI